MLKRSGVTLWRTMTQGLCGMKMNGQHDTRARAATFDLWLRQGLERGWLNPVCLMHDDMSVWTQDEMGRWHSGDDICIPRYVVPFTVD